MSRRIEATTKRAHPFVGACVALLLTLTTAVALADEHDSPPSPHGATTAAAHEHSERADAAAAQAGEHHAAAAAGEHHAAAEPHAAAGHHGPEALNWTDIYDKKRPAVLALVINFGALMALYYVLGKKPIAEALKQRRIRIGKDIDEAQALLAEAKERAKTYQAELKSADADAATAKDGLIAAGKGEVERLLTEAQDRAERMKRDADRLVEQERKQVARDLTHETVELAVREAAQLLEKSVTAEDHARLAHDLLAELSRRPGSVSTLSTGGGST